MRKGMVTEQSLLKELRMFWVDGAEEEWEGRHEKWITSWPSDRGGPEHPAARHGPHARAMGSH